MKKHLPLVSIVTVNYNGKKLLKDCFRSLFKLDYPKKSLEIIMVDNSSSDGSREFVRKNFPQVKIINNSINNYAKANNLGIKAAKGKFIALINNDVKVDKGWLRALIDAIQKDDSIGAVGSKILFTDGSIQSVGHQEYPNFYWGDIGFRDKDSGQYNNIKEVISICGCSVLYRRKCLDKVGLLDEDFNMFMEDVDMAIRCKKKGWKLVISPKSIIYHKFHSTIGDEDGATRWQEENRLLLIAKHWPNKLADALSGKDYFTANNDYGNNEDISSILGKIFVKLIKEHGEEFTNRLIPDLFDSVRKIYNFEKDKLMQTAKFQKLNIISKEQKIHYKEQQIASLSQNIEALRQEKEQQIAYLSQNLEALRQEKEQQIAYLSQNLETLRQEKEQRVISLNQSIGALRQQKDKELNECRMLLHQKQKELYDVYMSTGFRYLLRPLWNILWPIKKRVFVLKQGILSLIISYKHKIKRNNNKPTDIHFQITDRCNLQCRHCDIWRRKSNKPELDTKEWKKVVDTLYKWLGRFNVHFCGGEPFIRNDLLEIIEYCSTKGIKTFVTTNFTLISPEMVERIVRSGLTGISFSLDSIDSEKVKYLRSREDAFERLKILLNEFKLYKHRPHIAIATILMGYNLDDIPEIIDLIRKKVIFDSINFQPLFCNFGSRYNSNWHLGSNLWPKDLASAEKTIDYLLQVKKNEEIIDNPSSHLRLMKTYFRQPESFSKHHSCIVGFDNLNITPYGEVLLCWEKKPIGNVLNDLPEKLWFSERAKVRRKEIANCNRSCSILNCNYIQDNNKNVQLLVRQDVNSVANPENLIFTITTKCNFLCRHCELPLIEDERKELNAGQIKQFVYDLHQWLGKINIELTGGEPLLREDVFDIISFISRLDKAWIHMSSNGYLIDNHSAKKIIDSGLSSIGISLDAVNSNIHDYLKNKQGAHGRAIEAIRLLNLLRGNKMKLSIQAIIMNFNLEELDKIVEFAIKNKLNGVSFQPILEKFGKKNSDLNWYKKSEFWPKDRKFVASTLDKLIRIKNKNKNDEILFFNSVTYLNILKKYYKNPNSKFFRKCGMMKNIYLSPYGDVMLCPFFKPIGNIIEARIRDIWFSREAQNCRERIRDCRKSCSLMMCIYDK